MDLSNALLDSWDRQCRILDSVAALVTEETRHLLPSPDGWPLDLQLAHIHGVRREWLGQLNPNATLETAFDKPWQSAIQDLDAIRAHLKASAQAVRDAVKDHLEKGTEKVGAYDHPVLFLQHMVWHEGWHIGLIFLGLRLAGKEPTDEWEEENVWGQWRTE